MSFNDNAAATTVLWPAPSEIQADLASLSRVSHRLAMIDNGPQFESVVSKLLPKLLTRIGRNHQQQLTTMSTPPTDTALLRPLLEQVQSKLMEILSHVLNRVKQSTTSTNTTSISTSASAAINGQAPQPQQDPLPCQGILDLLVVLCPKRKNDNDKDVNENEKLLQVQDNVDALTKNLSLTFLSVGIPKCANPLPLVPGLLVCLHQEQQQLQHTPAASTLTWLLLQCLVAGGDLPSPSQEQDIKSIRTLLLNQEECAAVLYELILNVLMWTPANTTTTTSASSGNNINSVGGTRLPPAGLSPRGQERLQQCTPLLQKLETKLTLLDWIAPARKGIFFCDQYSNNGKTRVASKNLARTWTLLLAAKGQTQPTVSERAQTYWQMNLQSQTHKTTTTSNNNSNSAPNKSKKQKTTTTTNIEMDAPPVASKAEESLSTAAMAQQYMTMELLSLTMGQVQAEELVTSSTSSWPKTTKMTAMPLHTCDDAHIDRGNETIIYDKKRRAVPLSPTSSTFWAALANNPQIGTGAAPKDQEDGHYDGLFLTIVWAKMVALLAHKYLSGGSSLQGPSTGMSALQAKPYLALTQLMQTLVVSLCHDPVADKDSDDSESGKDNPDDFWTTITTLQLEFMKTCCDLLKQQVVAAASSISNSTSSMIMNSEGSWAVREQIYAVICLLCRSNNNNSYNRGDSGCHEILSMETANLLFACAAKEHDRLRPKAVAALDALLEAFVRIHKTTAGNDIRKSRTTSDGISSKLVKEAPAINPWASMDVDRKEEIGYRIEESTLSQLAAMAKSLLPLLWNASQTHQTKASRVAATRWAGELLLLPGLNMTVQACHLLCFLAGDVDVTAASLAKQYLFPSSTAIVDDDEFLSSSFLKVENDGAGRGFADFASFVQLVFDSTKGADIITRVQRYWDFSFLGKASALRYGLSCLLSDMYGDDQDAAIELYLSAMIKTLDYFASEESLSNQSTAGGRDRSSVDLLDQCCVCLLATLKSSPLCRQVLLRASQSGNLDKHWMTITQLEDLAIQVKSSKARRHLAGILGAVYEEDVSTSSSFADWMRITGARSSLERCACQLSFIEKHHFQLGKLHGAIFLSGHILRAIRLRLLHYQSSDVDSVDATTLTRILHLLGTGILHREEVLSRASVDAIAIALSFESLDAPQLDGTLDVGSTYVLETICKGIKKFGDGDAVDPNRATGLVRTAGIVLAATSLTKNEALHKARHICLQAVFSVLGSTACRKDEEIALVAGESLAIYADSCQFESSGLGWLEVSDFQEELSLKLPPQEYVLYFLLAKHLVSSSPPKRTATAPALLGLVGRAARLGHLNDENCKRSFIKAIFPLLARIQEAFIALLADPKINHFSKESCCLGLVACRGLAAFDSNVSEISRSARADALNQQLLRAFGQTANYGGSAYQETNAQAEQRRAAEQGGERQRNVDQIVLEPFGIESEVGGAAGIGEAALGAYREMASASLALDRPDVLYALLLLSVSHPAWFAGERRENYSAAALLGDSNIVGSRTNSLQLRKALRGHLGKLLPRILRACNDPNKQTRDQMGVLWTGLTGGGEEAREAITEHFLSTVDVLIQDASNKLWRARAGATGALADVIVGRNWESFGGGPPVLNDDDMHDDRPTEFAGVRMLRLWRVVVRSLDDVRDTVRINGERLGRALRSLTIRLCDSSVLEKSSGKKMTREEKARWARDASAASATSLRWLVKHGLSQADPVTQGLCISTLVELIAIAKPSIIEPSLPDVLRSLLLSMSSLEPAALNYVQLRTNNQEGLERARLRLAQSGPLATAVAKCVDLLPNARQGVQRQVVCELDAALRLSVGFATRAAVADTASMMTTTCPGAFSFPGTSGNANPSVRLMRAFYFAAERERGQGAKDKMIHALGNLASLCPGGSVRSLAIRACKCYKSSTGNNDDPSSRRAVAAALRAIAVRASNQMNDGGSFNIWSETVLPVAFLGQKDADKKTAAFMKEVWDEGGVAVETTVKYGTSREEQLLPGLVREIKDGLQDVSWARRIAASCALEELCDQGVLVPLSRCTGQQKISSQDDLERSRRRAVACHDVIIECARVVLKPRLWTGKNNVVSALSKLISRWTAVQAEAGEDFLFGWEGGKSQCPWTPVSINPDKDNLFVGDNWFGTGVKMGTEFCDDDQLDDSNEVTEAPLDSETSGAEQAEAETKIDFSAIDDADQMTSEKGQITSDEYATGILSLNGICRVLVNEALPENKIARYQLSEEYLPYRSSCLEAVHDLLASLPSSDIKRKSLLFGLVGSKLLSCIQNNDDSSSGHPPVVVSHAVDCLVKCLWDGFGSQDDDMVEVIDPVELCILLRDVSGKQQPAWTVRKSGSSGLAGVAAVCDGRLLRNSRVIEACLDCSTYACRDKKFWRVREAGLRLLGTLVRRVGPSFEQREILLLEALLPHKEDMLRILRAALSDSEPAVTTLGSEILPLLSWWP